jgi:hypothetical protein
MAPRVERGTLFPKNQFCLSYPLKQVIMTEDFLFSGRPVPRYRKMERIHRLPERYDVEKLPILCLDVPGYKPLPSGFAMRMSSEGAEFLSATDINSGLTILRGHNPVAVLITNASHLELLQAAREYQPHMATVLVTAETMEQINASLGGEEHTLVDHCLANRHPNPWSINEMRVTVQKILRHDLFGIDKYLETGTAISKNEVTGSADRERLNNLVMQFAEQNKFGSYLSRLVYGITEELLMNAIYDAPQAANVADYIDLPRTSPIVLKPEYQASLSFGCDGQTFAIGIRDPFGAFTHAKFFAYMKKVLKKRDSEDLIDSKKGGAGLGLFKILYSSHSLVCNVDPGKATEVIALIDINEQVRDFSKVPRTVCFFQ